MADWLKKRMKLQKITDMLKDQVSLGRALSKHGKFSQIELSVLRVIKHDEHLPSEDAVQCVLSVGSGSRMHVAHCIRLIMDRLSKTQNWIVAIKILVLIHRCLLEGGFMFQDQLTVQPKTGGRNYLNLSTFKDRSSAMAWTTSSWIRWYARFIEQWIQTSKTIGSFLDFKVIYGSILREELKALPNFQLVKEIVSLNELLLQISGWEAQGFIMDHVLIKEGLRLVALTMTKAYQGIQFRFKEVRDRMKMIGESEAIKLLQVCDSLSSQSLMLTHFLEVMDELVMNKDDAVSGKTIFNEYDLMKLREALTAASRDQLGKLKNGNGYAHSIPHGNVYALSVNSMRWGRSTIVEFPARRGGSMSDISFYEDLLKI